MTQSSEADNPAPGFLSGEMGRFAPPLPEGSWQRLQARRRRRRRVAIWVFSLLATLLAGAGSYGVIRLSRSHTPPDIAKPQPTQTEGVASHSRDPGSMDRPLAGLSAPSGPSEALRSHNQGRARDLTASASSLARPDNSTPRPPQAPGEPSYALDGAGAAHPAHPDTSPKEAGTDVATTHPQGTSSTRRATRRADRMTIPPLPLTDATRGPRRSPRLSETWPRHTKPQTSHLGHEPRSTSHQPSRFRSGNDPSTLDAAPGSGVVAREPLSPPPPGMPDPVEGTPTREPSRSQTLWPESMGLSEDTTTPASPVAALQEVDTSAAATTPVVASEVKKRRVRFEAGGGALYWQQRAYSPYHVHTQGETARQADGLPPTLGLQGQVAILYRLSGRFALRPHVGLSALYQQTRILTAPGPNAPVTLSYDSVSNIIRGTPTRPVSQQVESRLLLLPSAGLSLLWQPGALGLLAGIHYQAVLTRPGNADDRPRLDPASYHVGLLYPLTRRLTVQADIRRLTLKDRALPGITGSQSQGWLGGVSLYGQF